MDVRVTPGRIVPSRGAVISSFSAKKKKKKKKIKIF